MRSLILVLFLSGLAGCGRAEPAAAPAPERVAAPEVQTARQPIAVTSTDFAEGQMLALGHAYSGFGCVGSNRSPALSWEAVPEARSYAVTMFDPDAPGDGWWHWTVANLPASTTSLPAGAGGRRGQLPQGAVQGRTDFDEVGYGGPCPPVGRPHRYVFTVYALSEMTLPVDTSTDGAAFKAALEAAAIAQGTLTGMFGR
jgi:Raf kinase inhibitor-like YbhB/YbcL family protein